MVDERVAHLVDNSGRGLALEAEGGLNDADLGGRRVEAGEGTPVVDHHTGTNHFGTAVDGSGDQWDLEERRQLVELGPRRLGVNKAALGCVSAAGPPLLFSTRTHLVGEGTVRANEDVGGNGLAEDLDLEGVGNNLFRLAVNVGVDERDVVVAGNHVAEGRQPLLDTLDGNGGRERVAEVLQLLVGRGGGHEEAVAVAGGQAADDARAGNGRVHDGDDIAELGLKGRVKVARGGKSREAVAVM